MGRTGCTYQATLHAHSHQQICRLNRGGSLKSHTGKLIRSHSCSRHYTHVYFGVRLATIPFIICTYNPVSYFRSQNVLHKTVILIFVLRVCLCGIVCVCVCVYVSVCAYVCLCVCLCLFLCLSACLPASVGLSVGVCVCVCVCLGVCLCASVCVHACVCVCLCVCVSVCV